MSTALIVGGDQIDGIKQELANFGIQHINHWSGRKVGDGKKIIPQDTELIVLITDWISHTFTHKIKQSAAKRGVRIVYTPNGPAALRSRLARIKQDAAQEADCQANPNQGPQQSSNNDALPLAA
jgi:hypothetical protein